MSQHQQHHIGIIESNNYIFIYNIYNIYIYINIANVILCIATFKCISLSLSCLPFVIINVELGGETYTKLIGSCSLAMPSSARMSNKAYLKSYNYTESMYIYILWKPSFAGSKTQLILIKILFKFRFENECQISVW